MEISIPKSKLKLILLGLGALLFVSLGILFLIYKDFFNINIYILIISSYFGIPFFGSILVFISFSIFSKKPAVVINEKGITDNSAMISIGFIEWSEIENIFPYKYINQTFIGIRPKDISTFLSRFPPFKRFLLSLNKNLVAAPLNIALTSLKISTVEFIDIIDKYFHIENIEDIRKTYGQSAVDQSQRFLKQKIISGTLLGLLFIPFIFYFSYSFHNPIVTQGLNQISFSFGLNGLLSSALLVTWLFVLGIIILRFKSRFSWVAIAFGLIFLLAIPGIFSDKVTIDNSGFTWKPGYFVNQKLVNVSFSELRSIHYYVTSYRNKNKGRTKIIVLEKLNGDQFKYNVTDLLECAMPSVFSYAKNRGIMASKETFSK